MWFSLQLQQLINSRQTPIEDYVNERDSHTVVVIRLRVIPSHSFVAIIYIATVLMNECNERVISSVSHSFVVSTTRVDYKLKAADDKLIKQKTA